LLVVGIAGLRLVVQGRVRRPAPLHAMMATFVLWSGLSFLWTADPEMTASRVGSYIQLLVLVWLIWELAPEEKQWAALLRAYSFGAGIAAINTIRNLLGGGVGEMDYDQLSAYGRYAPDGFDQNELALLLALSVPMTIYLTTRRQSKLLELLSWSQLVLAGTAILLTGSRAGLICLLMAFTMILFAMPYYPRWKKTLCAAVIVLAGVGALMAVPATTWNRLLTLGSEVSEGTLNHRTLIWAAGLAVFRDHPFVGVGSGAYGPSVLPRLDIAYVAHNSFLSVLVELGVVGALILASLLASMLYLAARMRPPQKWLWIIVLITWAAGVSSLTWEYRKATWFLFGMLAAQAGILRRQNDNARA
jgi:O-Antigen ligase